MDMTALSSMIELHRPLTILSSLPIATADDNGSVKALWFNYSLDQSNDDLKILIRSIFTMGDNLVVNEIGSDIVLTTKIEEFDEPELSEEEYLSLLEKQFACFDDAAMRELVGRAEMLPLLIAYEAATKYTA